MRILKRFPLADRYLGVSITLIALNVIFAFASPYYWSTYNLTNILDHSSISLVLSVGMVFVLATGGIDLSVGSTLALTGIITALAMQAGVPASFAVLFGLLLGATIGSINGWIISKFKLQPFIVTLVMLSIVRGLTLVVSGGSPIIGMPEGFMKFFSGPRLLSNGVYVAAFVAIIAGGIFVGTPLGRSLRSIGGNEEAAYLCGVNTPRVRIFAHAIAGICAAIASMLFMAGMDAAEPIAGLTTEWMEAIAAPIIGGNTLSGGRAYIVGAVLGVLILSTIKSGLNMVGVGQHFQQIAIGSVIIAAVIIDSLRTRSRRGGA